MRLVRPGEHLARTELERVRDALAAMRGRSSFTHCTAPSTWRTSSSFTRAGRSLGSASTLAITGNARGPTARAEGLREPVARGAHERAVKGRAHLERDGLAPSRGDELDGRGARPACPAITICPGALKFAGRRPRRSARWPRRTRRLVASGSRPMMAAIAPSPSGTAACMASPRRRQRRTASSSPSAPRRHERAVLTQRVARGERRGGAARAPPRAAPRAPRRSW
jgi:hypothetical protein